MYKRLKGLVKSLRRPTIGRFIGIEMLGGTSNVFCQSHCGHASHTDHVRQHIGERVGRMVAEFAAVTVMSMRHLG